MFLSIYLVVGYGWARRNYAKSSSSCSRNRIRRRPFTKWDRITGVVFVFIEQLLVEGFVFHGFFIFFGLWFCGSHCFLIFPRCSLFYCNIFLRWNLNQGFQIEIKFDRHFILNMMAKIVSISEETSQFIWFLFPALCDKWFVIWHAVWGLWCVMWHLSFVFNHLLFLFCHWHLSFVFCH